MTARKRPRGAPAEPARAEPVAPAPPAGAALLALDARLAAAGFHALTPWWRAELGRWYASGARRFVARVGRGGIKSGTAVKVALAEVLMRTWKIAPGERHVFAFVSTNMAEARQRLAQIHAALRALAVEAERSGDELALKDLPLAFRVFAASVGAVSGFRCVGFVADELAKWRTADDSANPAPEVLASLRAMTVTHPEAREFLISSPWGKDDAHAAAIADGDTDEQCVACAPTWIANPSVTEEQTRRLERDERVWKREYLAEPQDAALAAFDAAAIDRAFAHPRASTVSGAPAVIVDPSSGRKDSWTWCGVRWALGPEGGDPFLLVDDVDAVGGRFFDQRPASTVVGTVAALVARIGAYAVHGDQREAYALSSMFGAHTVAYRQHDWTSTSKPAAVAALRRLFADGRIALPQHEALRRELLAFEERITPSGALTFGARGTGHDDFVSLLLTACMADLAGELARPQPRRVEPEPDLGTDDPDERAYARAALVSSHGSRWRRAIQGDRLDASLGLDRFND